MPDYKKMYFRLFREITDVIIRLQIAKQDAEEIFISDETENNLFLLNLAKEDDDADG